MVGIEQNGATIELPVEAFERAGGTGRSDNWSDIIIAYLLDKSSSCPQYVIVSSLFLQ